MLKGQASLLKAIKKLGKDGIGGPNAPQEIVPIGEDVVLLDHTGVQFNLSSLRSNSQNSLARELVLKLQGPNFLKRHAIEPKFLRGTRIAASQEFVNELKGENLFYKCLSIALHTKMEHYF